VPAVPAATTRRPAPGAAPRRRAPNVGAHSILFDPEHQPASDPVRLDQPNRNLVPEPEDPP
jgi:hypothetical protein